MKIPILVFSLADFQLEPCAMDPTPPERPLEELERVWRERFSAQPKLPSSALLLGALAMALGFAAAFFFVAWAWWILGCVFLTLSILAGLLNRLHAKRWYESEVLPWAAERAALKAEIERLRSRAGNSR
jgi:hypothetical protein